MLIKGCPAPQQTALLELMYHRQDETPQPTLAELGKALGVSKQFVHARIGKLKARGLVVTTKAGRWRVRA